MEHKIQQELEIVHDFKQKISGIAIDSEDNIFVANYYNYSIDKVSLNNGKVSITQSAKISPSPYALAINSKNELYFSTNNGGEIKKMTKEGIISNIAGDGTRGFADGIGKEAQLGAVYGICFDENDIAYFCDYSLHSSSSIRKLTSEGRVSTICGNLDGDNDGKQVKFTPYGIAYNYLSKILYITDRNNCSIRTMTVNGNANTLCKYSDYLYAITIDGKEKLYLSTVKDNGDGELLTVDTKGEIGRMNISIKWCRGITLNSKGDLFFTSDTKLCVIRNCTKYPPHPIFSPLSNINLKGKYRWNTTNIEDEIETSKILFNQQAEIQELRKQLAASEQKLLEKISQMENEFRAQIQDIVQKLKEKGEGLENIQFIAESEKQVFVINDQKKGNENSGKLPKKMFKNL